MRDLLPVLSGWYAAHAPFGLATVVAVSRSAPRDPGAAMAVGPGDEVVGSVSGGCVEGAVFELAREVVASGEARLRRSGTATRTPSRSGSPAAARSPCWYGL